MNRSDDNNEEVHQVRDSESNVIPISGRTSIQSSASAMSDKNTPPEYWVETYLRMNGIKYDYKTGSLRQNGEPLEYKTLISMMRLYANNLGVECLSYYFKDAMTVWMRKESIDFLNRLRESLSYQESKIDLCAKWVKAVTGKSEETDIAGLRHFIWQVKRKMFGLEIVHHIMPVMVGASGGGKSYALHKLLQPVKEVTIGQSMRVFNDPFSRRMYVRNFVMLFDELSQAKQADINCMKNIITAPTVEWRGMQSEVINSGRQNCTFIGASNHRLSESIVDPTGMRRFWEWLCSEKLDWEAVNSIDYLLLWRSVDQQSPCPLLPVLGEIRVTQQSELQVRDPVEEWLSFACKTASLDENSPTTSDLYQHFANWCNSQKISGHPTLQKFSRSLSEKLSHELHPKHTSRGTTWPLMVT